MNRNIIGDWGADLDDQDYSAALAALGVLEATGTIQHQASSDPLAIMAALREEFKDGDRTVVWRGALNITGVTPEGWRNTIHRDAGALAEGWRLLLNSANHARKQPRLAVAAGWCCRPDLYDLEILSGWLGRSGCQALVLLPEDVGECRSIWHWPLHVGVPAGTEGRKLLGALKSLHNRWIENLALLRPLGEARDACDLLLLPTGMAAHLAEQPSLRLQASFIVCFDDPAGWNKAAESIQALLRAKMGAAGIALVGAAADPVDVYTALIYNLSHDIPIHAALWSSDRDCLMGKPQALDRLRILAIAEHLDRKLELLLTHRLQIRDKTKPLPPGRETPLPDGFGFAKGRLDAPEALEPLGTRLRSRAFVSEVHDGITAANDIAERDVELEERRSIRHIQAHAWRRDLGSEPARSLDPERPSLLTVHIGPSEQPLPGPVFPEGRIDFTAGPVEVTVQLELAGAAAVGLKQDQRIMSLAARNPHFLADPVTSIPSHDLHGVRDELFQLLDTLPTPVEPHPPGKLPVGLATDNITLPAAGTSTSALFAVRPHPDVKEVQGRIAIIHQNRIIQTSRLTAPVGPGEDNGCGICVEAEAGVHSRLDDLAERRQFDIALITADDLGSRLRLTVSCDGDSREAYVDNLEDMVRKIRSVVYETVRGGREDTLSLESENMRIILLSLASHGRLLYDCLRRELGGTIEMDRLQLVSRGTAFFPLEYIYDGPRLKTSARVCSKAAGEFEGKDCCLRGGKWNPCPNEGSEDHICPLHFWGLSKVIERHGEVSKDQLTGSSGVDRRKLPSPTRCSFGAVQPVLLAASKKAFDFPTGPQWRLKLFDSLSRLGGGTPPVEAKTWNEWKAAVGRTDHPKVLVLLTHTEKVLIDVDALQIAETESLRKDEVDDRVVGPDNAVQLLLLLGCGAAQVGGSFAPWPFLFRDSGADIVIAPLEAILGADAVPIGEKIANLLADGLSAEREIAFGELLRELRRTLLADGHPGVLGLVGFGDADWVFEG